MHRPEMVSLNASVTRSAIIPRLTGGIRTGAGTLIVGLALASAGSPALAHQVQIADDVGGTLHIEPNDTPRAQADSQLWFALNRQGGEVIPLSACDCSVRVYSATDSATPIAQPPLQPVSAEGYSDIPGASVIFPEVGAYTVVIAGSPTGQVEFTPFELSYPVTVAAAASPAPQVEGQGEGESPNPPPVPTAQIATSADRPRQGPLVWPFIAAGTGIGLLLWLGWQRGRAKKKGAD